MNIIVTGGSGFIGSHLTDALIDKNHNVIVIDNLKTSPIENLNKKATHINLDISDNNFIKNLTEILNSKIDAIFHYAALVDANESFSKKEEYEKINIQGTKNIVELCTKLNINKIIFASSGGAIYGNQNIPSCNESQPHNPLNPYGETKIEAEKLFNNNATILRFSNVYGPRQKAGVIPIFINKIKNNQQPIIFGTGNHTRDFIFISDIIDINLKVLESNIKGIYNISSNIETSINDIIKHLSNIFNKEIQPIHKKELNEVKRSCIDNKKAKESFNWNPKVDIETGLKLTI